MTQKYVNNGRNDLILLTDVLERIAETSGEANNAVKLAVSSLLPKL